MTDRQLIFSSETDEEVSLRYKGMDYSFKKELALHLKED
jgi:hypothetical protein